jgi:hypothetical protein
VARKAMTPLAHRFTKEIIDGKHQDIKDDLKDIHCFQLTGCIDLIEQMADDFSSGDAKLERLFLPFPKTWIEFNVEGHKFAYLLQETEQGAIVHCFGEISNGDIIKSNDTGLLDFERGGGYFEDSATNDLGLHYMLCSALTLINTPQNVGSKKHHAHKGLVRQTRAIDGIFPINAWTEIDIRLGTRINTGNGSHELRRKDGVALHWVRAYKRNHLGRTEKIAAHFRGDIAFGFKQSRYVVQ